MARGVHSFACRANTERLRGMTVAAVPGRTLGSVFAEQPAGGWVDGHYGSAMPRLDPTARVRSHIEGILAEGPVPFDDLVSALLDRGLDLGPEPDERLDDVLATMERVDFVQVEGGDEAGTHVDWCFDRLALFDGTTWTVPISELDLASDTLPTEPLGPLLGPLLNDWCTLDGAGTIDLDIDGRRQAAADSLGVVQRGGVAPSGGVAPRGGVSLPTGWLAAHGARSGGFLLLQLDDGVVGARDTDLATSPSPALVDALSGSFASPPSPQACRHFTEVLIEIFVLHPELRGSELPPLADLVEAAGLVRDGIFLAQTGFDFERERLRRRVEDVATEMRFEDDEAQAYATLVVAWHGWSARSDGVQPEVLVGAAHALEHIRVATVFVEDECDPDEPDDLDEVASFGESLIDAVSGRHRAGPAWLVAQALLVAGRTDRFEEWIDVALGFDDEHILSLYDKAWFEFDRGEAKKAKTLLSRVGAGTFAHDLAILDAVLAPTRPTARRNDPCPCGSGRKYKVCHLGVDEAPLDDRLTWLYRKANWWLDRRHRPEVEAMAWVRAGTSGMSPARLLEMDPLIADAVLAEGGRFAEWLSERGALLPSDEALLAARWALVDRSVFEVTDVRLDEGMTLRDLRTGDIVDVQERIGTHGMEVGRYILARPLPTGSGGRQFFGGITIVPDSARDRFIELLDEGPTPARLLSVVADSEAPPKLSNRDGHATVFCETTWTIPDTTAATEALDAAFESSDEAGRWSWMQDGEDHADVTAAGGRTVLGTLALDDDRLTASTNSAERADAISQIVMELLPGAQLVEDLRSDFDEVQDDLAYERAVFGEDDEPSGGFIDPSQAPPEVRAVLRQQMDQYEEAWVDESIPALGGATPREALDDPTRRDDLFRLLDRMEQMDAGRSPEERALGMRTSRLRELLGLPARGELRLPKP